MMKRILILIIFTVFSVNLFSQQLPMYSQYMENGFLINPAMAGSRLYSPLRLSMRQQWTGVDGAPSTKAISFNRNMAARDRSCKINGNPFSRRNNNFGAGIGASLYTDSYGAVSRSGADLSYAYHLQLSGKSMGKRGTHLAFGLGGTFYQFKFDGLDIPENDPLYGARNEVSYVPDFSVGAYLYNDSYFIGLSVANILESSIKIGDDSFSDNLMTKHFYFTAGYTFHINEYVDFEPSVMARKTVDSDVYYDISAKLFVRSMWFAMSYRNNSQLVGMLGINFAHYYLGYSYDHYSNNLLAEASVGSHELTLGMNFDVPNSVLRSIKARNRAASRKSGTRKRNDEKEQKKFLLF